MLNSTGDLPSGVGLVHQKTSCGITGACILHEAQAVEAIGVGGLLTFWLLSAAAVLVLSSFEPSSGSLINAPL